MKVIVGARLDLVESKGRKVSKTDAQRLSRALNPDIEEVQCFETSSLTGEGITEMFEYVFKTYLGMQSSLYRRGQEDNDDNNIVVLTRQQQGQNRFQACCMYTVIDTFKVRLSK